MAEIKKEIRDLFRPIYLVEDTIFCDMDGVVAEWGTEGPAPTFQPGYFKNRPAVEKAISLIKMLRANGFNVVMLSAVYTDGTAAVDKVAWLQEFLPDVPFVFVPYGEKKCDYVYCNGLQILIDDYSVNLHEWKESGGIGIKFMNGVNGSKGTWSHDRLEEEMSVEEMYEKVVQVINEQKKKK